MFIDANSKIDREGLRTYVLAQLQTLHKKAEHVCHDKLSFWQQLELMTKRQLFGKEQEKTLKIILQLKSLPSYITGWIDLAVDSPERFDFFVMTKAHELQSGNQDQDYYWALQIRHDQLVALVRVLEMLLDKMTLWTSLRPEQVYDDPVFSGLTDYDIEDQVYLEAEEVYRERMKLMQGN